MAPGRNWAGPALPHGVIGGEVAKENVHGRIADHLALHSGSRFVAVKLPSPTVTELR